VLKNCSIHSNNIPILNQLEGLGRTQDLISLGIALPEYYLNIQESKEWAGKATLPVCS